MGRKLEFSPEQAELEVLESTLRNIVPIVARLQELGSEPLTPESAGEVYELLSHLIRLSVLSVPEKKEAVEYLVEQMAQMVKVPSGISIPKELDYSKKHLGLQQFIHETVNLTDESELETFLKETWSDHRLLPQFQRAVNEVALPKALRRPISARTVQAVERLKLAIRDVTSDWEALVSLVYGFALLKQGKQASWANIRKVNLWDKTQLILDDSRLNSLARREWVTVRNSLDHGAAFYDPNKNSIEFRDNTRVVSWSIDQTLMEGIDIYLANSAMLRTQIFVQWERFQPFINFCFALRGMSKQP